MLGAGELGAALPCSPSLGSGQGTGAPGGDPEDNLEGQSTGLVTKATTEKMMSNKTGSK